MNKGLSKTVAVFAAVVFIHGCTKPQQTVVQSQTQRNWLGADDAAMSSAQELEPPRILPKTHFAAGLLFEQSGQWQKAVDQYQKAVTVNHQYVEAYAHMGMLRSKLGQHVQAEMDLRRALQLKPDSARMHNNLGYEYAIQRRWSEAQVELNHAIRLQPDFARAYVNLGMVLAKQLRFEESLESFNAALPEADAYYNLALMFRSEHRFRDAADAFRHVLALNPAFPAAARQLEEIESRIQPITVPDSAMLATVDHQTADEVPADLPDQDIMAVDPGDQDMNMSLPDAALVSNDQSIDDSIDDLVGLTSDAIVPADLYFEPEIVVTEPQTQPMVTDIVVEAVDHTPAPVAPPPVIEPIIEDVVIPMAVSEPLTDRPIDSDIVVEADHATPIVQVTETWTHDPTFELQQDDPCTPDAHDASMTAAVTPLSSEMDDDSVMESTADPVIETVTEPVVVDPTDTPTLGNEIELTASIMAEPTIVAVTPTQPIDSQEMPVDSAPADRILAERPPIESFMDDEIVDWILADITARAPCPDQVPGVDPVDITIAPPTAAAQDIIQPTVIDQPVGFPLWGELSQRAHEYDQVDQPDLQTHAMASTVSADSPVDPANTEMPLANMEPIVGPPSQDTMNGPEPAQEISDWTISDASPNQDTGTLAPPSADCGSIPFDLQEVGLWHWAQQTATRIDRLQPPAQEEWAPLSLNAFGAFAEIDLPAEAFLHWPVAVIPQDDDFDDQMGPDGILSIADVIDITTADLVAIDPAKELAMTDLDEIDFFVADLTASETVLLDSPPLPDLDPTSPCPEFGLDLDDWQARLAGANVFGWANQFDAYALPPNMAWFGQQIALMDDATFPTADPSISMETTDTDLPPYFEGNPFCDIDGMLLLPDPDPNGSWLRPY